MERFYGKRKNPEWGNSIIHDKLEPRRVKSVENETEYKVGNRNNNAARAIIVRLVCKKTEVFRNSKRRPNKQCSAFIVKN